MKLIGIGCDIVSIKKFEKSVIRTPRIIERIFSPEERRNRSIESLAGIFAAKEAVVKALKIPVGNWKDIEVSHDGNGKPIIKICKNKTRFDVSISHDDGYAISIVTATNDTYKFI